METWKTIPSLDGYYEASNLGRIKSMARTIIRKNGWRLTVPEAIMTPNIGNQYGHLFVTIRVPNKKRRYMTVHRLIAEAFLGMPPIGHDCCHGPNGRGDNSIGNLSYGTRRENIQQMKDFGKPNYRGAPKLTSEQVTEMRSLKATMTCRQLAKMFGVHHSQVSRITSGKAYAQ